MPAAARLRAVTLLIAVHVSAVWLLRYLPLRVRKVCALPGFTTTRERSGSELLSDVTVP